MKFQGSESVFSSIVLGKIKTKHTLKKGLVVITVYGTGRGTKTDEFTESFHMAVDPQAPLRRMVPISGNVHAFHTIWPSSFHIFNHSHYTKIAT